MSGADPDSVDLLDPGVQACPFPAYDLLREHAPVWLDPKTGFYIITRYEDMRLVLKDTTRFSSSRGQYHRTLLDAERAERMRSLYRTRGWLPQRTLAARDGSDHKPMRALFETAFRAERINELDPFIRATAYRLIESFVGQGECDWIEAFAVPLPMIVIGRQMGAREEDIWRIRAWVDAWVQRLGLMQTEDEERFSVEQEIEAQHYFQPIFERLRREPDDTLLSELVNREIPEWGRKLTDSELHTEMMADTFVGGSETTTETLASGLLLLARNPAIWEALRADPDKHLRNFCEEVLRLESPVQGLFRRTTVPVELHGVIIPAGATINIRHGAANRDPQKFACPADIDLGRPAAGSHLAFGSGAHACVGAKLARRELYWGFKAFIDHIERFELLTPLEELAYKPSFVLRALRELKIRFSVKEPKA